MAGAYVLPLAAASRPIQRWDLNGDRFAGADERTEARARPVPSDKHKSPGATLGQLGHKCRLDEHSRLQIDSVRAAVRRVGTEVFLVNLVHSSDIAIDVQQV